MRFQVLAADYDGTLAQDGKVAASTVAALEKLCASGRRLLLVTGRELEELLPLFPEITLFERVVAENGALVFCPNSGETRALAEPPLAKFVEELRRRQVAPLSVGRVIVATWKPHEITVLEVIRDLGLDLQVIFNKSAVMVLPASVNKASGLTAALKELELTPDQVVGIGDAENDLALLSLCGCGVAVQNAAAMVKERADLVMMGDHGRGVEELIQMLLDNDLRDLVKRSSHSPEIK
jgi:hydroxymethylpyrimidine pyrophosphatase-like HAD family hydrolase